MNTVFERLLHVLKTGVGDDGEKKDIVVCPDEKDFSFDRLERKDAIKFLSALKTTKISCLSIHLSQDCEQAVPRRFRKLFKLRGECKIGVIRRKQRKGFGNEIMYMAPSIFNPRFVRDGSGVQKYIAVIRKDG